MEEKISYAEDIMKEIKKAQKKEEIDYINPDNRIENGYIIIRYTKLDLEELELMDGKIKMVLPSSFEIMEENLAKIKYPGEDRPPYIYTNSDTTVNVTFDLEAGQVNDIEIEYIRDLLEEQMLHLYPGAALEDDEILMTTEDKPIAIFSMKMPTLDGEIFQLTFIKAMQEGLLLGAFNCSIHDKKEWQPVVKQLLTTLTEIKGNN